MQLCKYIFTSSSLTNARLLFQSAVLPTLVLQELLATHCSSELRHTTFRITPLIPISPIMETWYLLTRQKIVFKTPQRKTSVPDRRREKEKRNWCSRESSNVNALTACDNMFLHQWEAENHDCSFVGWCLSVFITLMTLLEHFTMFGPLGGNWHDKYKAYI